MSLSVNEVRIGGRIYGAKKIETKSGKSMAAFTIRVYRKIKEKEIVTFFNCVCFSELADNVLNFGYERRECYVEGEFQKSVDKNGVEKYSILANNVQFLGDKV